MDEELLDVIGEFYAAATEAERWPNALEGMRRLLNGGACTHFLWNKQTKKVPVIYNSGLSDKVCDDYMNYIPK